MIVYTTNKQKSKHNNTKSNRYLDRRGEATSAHSSSQTAMRQAWPVLVRLYAQEGGLGAHADVGAGGDRDGSGTSCNNSSKNKSNNNGEWRMGDGWFEEAWEDQALLVRTIAR